MKIIKNIILSICVIIWFIWVFQTQARYWWAGGTQLSTDFPWDPNHQVQTKCDWNTDLGNCYSIKEDEKWWNETILRRLLEVFGLKKDKNNDLKFIDYLKAIINLALWLVSFIALVMTIYTFYLMIFSQNEKGIEKAKWNLIGIFIALAIIWLAWLIVSLIFRRYQSKLKANEDNIWAGNVSYLYDWTDNEIYFNTLL